MDIPASVEGLTPRWFSEALDVHVESVDVLDAHSGTTGRVRVGVKGDEALPGTLFVKLQPFIPEQREFVRMVGMGVAEAQLYAAVGDELPVRVPRVFSALYDNDDSSFVMVLEDLTSSGCRFPKPDDHDVLDVAVSLVDELAKLHSAYWGQELTWLGRHALSAGGGANQERRMAGGAALVQSALDQFAEEMPAEFRQLGEIYVTRYRDIGVLFNEGETTLIHGDSHIGNLFVDDGRTGFYDWAVSSRSPGMRDVAYFLCNSLPTEVRRGEEVSLLARYRAGLADAGILVDDAVHHAQYRLFSIYSWVSAATTASMGSRWQPAEVGRRAMDRTTQAIVDLEVLDLLSERLGGD
jgi:aminoglycoside phosphotransferase (APT) family kinase protein